MSTHGELEVLSRAGLRESLKVDASGAYGYAGGFSDVRLACNAWLRKRGLLWESWMETTVKAGAREGLYAQKLEREGKL